MLIYWFNILNYTDAVLKHGLWWLMWRPHRWVVGQELQVGANVASTCAEDGKRIGMTASVDVAVEEPQSFISESTFIFWICDFKLWDVMGRSSKDSSEAIQPRSAVANLILCLSPSRDCRKCAKSCLLNPDFAMEAAERMPVSLLLDCCTQKRTQQTFFFGKEVKVDLAVNNLVL